MTARQEADVQWSHIDARVLRILGEEVGRFSWGYVDRIVGREADVLVEGNTKASPGYRWYAHRPLVGEKALLYIGPPKGKRFIVALDREEGTAGALNVPQLDANGNATDETTSFVEALSLIGMATDSETAERIASHAMDPRHLIPHNTPNTGVDFDGQWALIGHGEIDARYGQVTAHVRLQGNGSTGTTWVRGELRFRIRQEAAFGSQPAVQVELAGGLDTDPTDYVVLVTSVAGPTTYEVYARLTRQHEWLSFRAVETDPEPPDQVAHTWVSCQSFIAAVPAGTSYVGAATPGAGSFGSVTAQTSYGASSGNGAATSYSRSDHVHGTVSHDAHASLTGVSANQHHNQAHGASDHTDRTRYIWLDRDSMPSADGASVGTGGTAPNAYTNWTLDDAVDEGMYGQFGMPADAVAASPISATVLWTAVGTQTGVVRFQIVALAASAGSDLAATGTTTAWDSAGGSHVLNIVQQEATTQILTSASAGDLIRINLKRLGTHANDTWAQSLRVVGIRIDYTADS